jgi:hypothetical protein
LTLFVGKESFLYFLEPLASDFGQGYRLEKFATGETYDVHLGADGHNSCECLGWLRWSHKTPCKHVASLLQLRAKGRLESRKEVA